MPMFLSLIQRGYGADRYYLITPLTTPQAFTFDLYLFSPPYVGESENPILFWFSSLVC